MDTAVPPVGPSWSASTTLRRAVVLSIVTLAIGAWGGGLSVLTAHFAVLPVFFMFIPLYFMQQWGIVRQLEVEPGLQPEQRTRYLSQVRFYGPAGVLQLALRIYFPSSGLGGT